MLMDISLVLFAYLLGSISSAIIICQLIGLGDPRDGGSRNPGATNVMRLYGKKVATITLIGDVLKGVIPIIICKFLDAPSMVIAISGLAAFIGHLYPLFFGFRGGKGVSTLLGVLIATHYLCALVFIITWLVVAFGSRYSALSALVAATITLLYIFWLPLSFWYLLSNTVMMALLFWRHRLNISRMIAGDENKIGYRS